MSGNRITRLMAVITMMLTLTHCNSQSQKNTTTEKTKNMKTIIVDVRTIEEWNEDGHADCSVNYPLDQIGSRIDELKKYDNIVLVCRSGNRAGIAKRQLENAGLINIENKGAWQNIACKN